MQICKFVQIYLRRSCSSGLEFVGFSNVLSSRIFLLILLSTLWKRRLDSAVDREKRQNVGKKQALLSLRFSLASSLIGKGMCLSLFENCVMQFFTDTIAEYLSHSTKKAIEAKRRRRSGKAWKKKRFYTFNQLFLRFLFKLSFAAFILSYLYLSTAYELFCKVCKVANFSLLHTEFANYPNNFILMNFRAKNDHDVFVTFYSFSFIYLRCLQEID